MNLGKSQKITFAEALYRYGKPSGTNFAIFAKYTIHENGKKKKKKEQERKTSDTTSAFDLQK